MGIWPFGGGSNTPQQPQGAIDPNTGPTLTQAGKEFTKRYERDVWWLDNKSKLGRIAIVLLIIVEVVLGLIGAWAFIDYFVFDYVEESRLVESFFVGADDLHGVVQEQVPLELEIDEARVISAQGKYDVVAIVTNPNQGHVARLSYRIEYDDRTSEQRHVVLLHDAQAPLVAFGVESPRPRSPKVIVDSIEWWRIDLHDIPDPMAWKDARLNLEFEDLRHDSDITIGDQIVSRTTANLKNQTGFGYYDVDVYVVLKRGGATLGVNRTVLSDVLPREERQFQLDWFGGSPSASAIEVYPIVNLFDETVYLSDDADPDRDRRDVRRRR